MKKLCALFSIVCLMATPLMHAIHGSINQRPGETIIMSGDQYRRFMRHDPRAPLSRVVDHRITRRTCNSSDNTGSVLAGIACVAFIGIVAVSILSQKTSSNASSSEQYNTYYSSTPSHYASSWEYDNSSPSYSSYDSDEEETYTVYIPPTTTITLAE